MTRGNLDIYRRILRYLRPYRREFGLALFCMVLFGASDGGVPFLVKHVLDGVFAQRNADLLYIIPVILVIFALVRALCDFGQQFLMSRVGHRIVRDLRAEINSKLLGLSPDYFISKSSADLLSRITSDVMLMRSMLTDSVAAVIRDTIRVVALLIAAIYLDPILALIGFVAFPLGIYPVYRFGRKMRRLSRQGQEAIGTLSAMMHESIIGNRVVKIFGRERFEEQRFSEENERLNATFVRSERVRALSGPVNEVLAIFAICGVILYGGFSVIGGARSQGDFIAFLIALFLLYDPFKKLSRVNNVVQQGVAGAERIFEILDTRPSVIESSNPRPLGSKNDIEFIDVHFSYANNSAGAALSAINLRIAEGEKVALVGFSGSGKSTLVDLLPRFIDPARGAVRIGDVDIRDVSLQELRKRIAMVGQHTFLFHDTVFNNIRYGREDATVEEVHAAARAAYAYDFISQLPKGFDSVVGEAGLALSGGERQRIAIARALLKNAPILVLDEATAALDNRSEREVQSALEALEEGRTTLMIAHRLSTVRRADCIYVLREGRIIESGRHDDLLARGGEYARLHALQFEERQDGETVDEALLN